MIGVLLPDLNKKRLTRKDRALIETTIDNLIGLLDQRDGDADFEPEETDQNTGDDEPEPWHDEPDAWEEPSLCGTDMSRATGCNWRTADREADCDDEPDADGELDMRDLPADSDGSPFDLNQGAR